ncbi:MAG: thioesterase [Methanobacteriota archaeon]|nr:MAG: thioesterase [Euryarchaeota archaeon]
MNLDQAIGRELVRDYYVSEDHTAMKIGSGDVNVLATPSMILFMEETAKILLQEFLGQRFITVGTKICVDHKRAVIPGEVISVKAKVESIVKKRVLLKVIAMYQGFVIGEGEHERYVVDKETFNQKIMEAR